MQYSLLGAIYTIASIKSDPIISALIVWFAFMLLAFAAGIYFFTIRYSKAKELDNLDRYEIAVRKEVEALPEFDEGDIYHS